MKHVVRIGLGMMCVVMIALTTALAWYGCDCLALRHVIPTGSLYQQVLTLVVFAPTVIIYWVFWQAAVDFYGET